MATNIKNSEAKSCLVCKKLVTFFCTKVELFVFVCYTFKIDGRLYFYERGTKNSIVDAFDIILLSVLL